MTKIYPNSPSSAVDPPSPSRLFELSGEKAEEPVVMTVWKKSLLFNCKGFTVYDSKGELVFRVDSYSSGSKDEIVLMDGVGKPVLTIRRKRLSLGENWLIYNGEETTNALFSVKKHSSLRHSKGLLHVTSCNSWNRLSFAIEGSYSNRCCVVYDEQRRPVADVQRKNANKGISLGDDVLRLIVQPELDAPLAMAIVILLEQAFGS